MPTLPNSSTPLRDPALSPWTHSSVQALTSAMSLEQKIGQVLIIGLPGPDVSVQVQAELEYLHPGGYILYDRNVVSPSQVARLNSGLQTAARANGDPPLFLTVDQEGGTVTRLPESKGFTEFPGQMALAATQDVECVRQIARSMSAELRAVGFNMDLTPDLDVNNNPRNPIIGTRSFGSDPAAVAELGVAFIEAMQAEGIAAVGKHFPGHGDTAIDSHVSLPTVPHARERLESVEFVPFRAAIQAGVASLMTAHITFPAIDPTPGRAATLSHLTLAGLLREEMRYDGAIMTDELGMGALATSGHPAPRAAVEALAAGADILLLQSGLEMHRQVQQELVAALNADQVPMARLDDAVQRVLTLKRHFGILDGTSEQALAPDQVGTAATRELAGAVAARAVTLVRDQAHLLPLKREDHPLVVETAAWGLGEQLGADSLLVPAQPKDSDIAAVLSASRSGRTVVVATSDVYRNPQQIELVAALAGAGVSHLVVAMQSPYDLLYLEHVPTYLAVFGANPPLTRALVDILRGRIPARGRLPIHLS